MSEPRSIRYCQMCGVEYSPHSSRPDGFACDHCGFELYLNQIVAVGAIIVNESNSAILLARRGREPSKGKWDVPGGFVHEREGYEEATRRELREELGVELASVELFGVYGPEPYEYQGTTRYVCSPHFLVRLRPESEPTPADDVAELRWFPLDALPAKEDQAFEVLESVLLDAVAKIRNNNEHA